MATTRLILAIRPLRLVTAVSEGITAETRRPGKSELFNTSMREGDKSGKDDEDDVTST